MRKIKKFLLKSLLLLLAIIGLPIAKKETAERVNTGYKAVVTALLSFVVFLLSFLLFIAIWVRRSFGYISINSILFTLEFAQDGFTAGDILECIVKCFVPAIFVTYIVMRLIYLNLTYKSITYKFEKSLASLTLRFRKLSVPIISMGVCFTCAVVPLLILPIVPYMQSLGKGTQIYDNFYVAPTSDILTFPEQKRNLVFIYLESMENTYADKDNAGAYDENYIPNLTAMAYDKENVSFSNTDKLGGASCFSSGMEYTMGSFVASTSGVPANSPNKLNKKDYKYKSFLPGITTLEDILHEQGYNQILIQGSTGYFAGMNLYYGRYDDTVFFPYESFTSEGVVDENYEVFWGVEDIKVYDYAKQQLGELSEQDEPFALTLFTIDTHRPDGYLCPLCKNEYDEKYANVISCADRQIADFITWLKEQGFYDNTTVIVMGDHPSMNEKFFADIGNYRRTTYNCFLNSEEKPLRTNGRVFTSADIFPTTLSAMGVEIKGDRLGLGTNLFSDRKTLAEEMGGESFVAELDRQSDYYDEHFWKEKEIKNNGA